MLRSACRSTPFGIFSSVSIGEFGEETRITKGNLIYDIHADNAWINKVVESLERNPEVIDNMYVIRNENCFKCGDRVINICYSNHGCAETTKDSFSECSIRYTSLYTFIENECRDYIRMRDLRSLVCEEYKVTEETAESALVQLIDNEYLITNLRIPPYCDNNLNHIITELSRCNITNEVVHKLKKIKELMEEVQCDLQETKLLALFDKMSGISSSKNYITVNLCNKLSETTLTYDIKDKIELFADILSQASYKHSITEKMTQQIIEKYGSNTKVPVLQLIKDGFFNINRIVDLTDNNDTCEEFTRVLNMKIQSALIRNESEVSITREDMSLCNRKGKWQSFETNVLVTDDKSGRNLWIGPNYGSNKAGKMIHRFDDCLPQDLLNKYNDSIKITNSKDIEFIEIREFRSYGEQSNVINNKRYSNYYMMLGNAEAHNDKNITIDDVLVSVENNQIITYSKRLDKQILFFINNMLNNSLNNKISRFLISTTDDYLTSPLDRVSHIINELNYKYVPRIVLSGVVVSPRRWHFAKNEINSKTFSKFKEDFYEIKNQFKIDDIVYLCRYDNRIAVRLDSDYFLKILFREYSLFEELELSEIEKGSPVVCDENGNLYLNECVFSIINKEPIVTESSRKSSELIQRNRCKLPLEDGWIYIKIYGDKNRQNDLITDDIPKLLGGLKYEKYYYIRYMDEVGDHIRLRIKLTGEKDIEAQKCINKWLQCLKKKNIINDVSFSVYEREINRYGGEWSIDVAEDFFYRNSELAKKLISSNDLSDNKVRDEVVILSLLYILNNMVEGTEKQFAILNAISYGDAYRPYYRKHRMDLIALMQKARIIQVNTTEIELNEQNRVLRIFNDNLISTKDSLSNDYDSIVLSLLHMNCNRLGLDASTERKYMELVRNLLYDYSRKEQNVVIKVH